MAGIVGLTSDTDFSCDLEEITLLSYMSVSLSLKRGNLRIVTHGAVSSCSAYLPH